MDNLKDHLIDHHGFNWHAANHPSHDASWLNKRHGESHERGDHDHYHLTEHSETCTMRGMTTDTYTKTQAAFKALVVEQTLTESATLCQKVVSQLERGQVTPIEADDRLLAISAYLAVTLANIFSEVGA